MTTTLFRQPRAVARHSGARFLQERGQYFEHLQQQGTSIHRIRVIAGMLLNVVRHLEISALTKVRPEDIENAIKTWVKTQESIMKSRRRSDAGAFRQTATNWLRFSNALADAAPEVFPYGTLLPEYLRFLVDSRSMTGATINGNKSRAARFLHWVNLLHETFATTRPVDVEDYIAYLRAGGMKPSSIASICHTLRGFFRFAESSGWTSILTSVCIAVPRTPRSEGNPKGPRWSEIRRMLTMQSGDGPADVRGDAVLHLLAVYAFRSTEVSSLRLADFDWEENVMTLRRAKAGRVRRFPITSAAREVLVRYLLDARPACSCDRFS